VQGPQGSCSTAGNLLHCGAHAGYEGRDDGEEDGLHGSCVACSTGGVGGERSTAGARGSRGIGTWGVEEGGVEEAYTSWGGVR
jgi:hypothetical protein